MSERRKFTREFKLAAIQPVLDGTIGMTERAEEVKVRRTTLQRWAAAYRALGDQAFPGSGQQIDSEQEIARLRQMVSELEMERDILKKAQEFFGKKKP